MRLRDRDMSIELTQAAKDLLATRGFDPVLGARPLRRTVQREIEDTLAEKMLYGEVRPGQIVLVDVEGEGAEATFTFKGEHEDRAARPAADRGRPPRVTGRGRLATPTARRSRALAPRRHHGRRRRLAGAPCELAARGSVGAAAG